MHIESGFSVKAQQHSSITLCTKKKNNLPVRCNLTECPALFLKLFSTGAPTPACACWSRGAADDSSPAAPSGPLSAAATGKTVFKPRKWSFNDVVTRNVSPVESQVRSYTAVANHCSLHEKELKKWTFKPCCFSFLLYSINEIRFWRLSYILQTKIRFTLFHKWKEWICGLSDLVLSHFLHILVHVLYLNVAIIK